MIQIEDKGFNFVAWGKYSKRVDVETFDKIIWLIITTYGLNKDFVPTNKDQEIIKEICKIIDERCDRLCDEDKFDKSKENNVL